MKTRFLKPSALIAAALLAVSLPAAAAPASAPAADVQTEHSMEIAKRVRTADLHGLWMNAAENEKGKVLYLSRINPDGTGTDILMLEGKEQYAAIRDQMTQHIKWTFDERKQQMRQTITEFIVYEGNQQGRPYPDMVGKTSTANVRMLMVDGKPGVLEFQDLANGEKTSYFSVDEGQFLKMMSDKQTPAAMQPE